LTAPRPAFAVALVLSLLLAVLNLVWIANQRLGYPLNYDEAAFMAMARYDSVRLVNAGPIGLMRAYAVQGPAAPLVPLVSVPAQVLGGPSSLPSFGVVQGFLVLLAMATYGLGARLGGPVSGLMAMLAVATAPGVISFSRTYHFAMPSAAVLATTLWALLQTEGFQRRWWSVTWGCLLGLLVLTRSVTLALVPGIVLAAAVTILTAHTRRTGLVNLGLGLFVTVVVASTWYGFNLLRVLEYLIAGGYGASAALYGESRSPASLDFWVVRLSHLIQQGLYLPLALLLLVFLVAGAVAAMRSRRAGLDGLDTSRSREPLAIGIVLISAYVALSSSSNVGSGFVLLLVPPLIVLAACLAGSGGPRGFSSLMFAFLVVVAGLNLIMTSGLDVPLAGRRYASVPVLGGVPVTDGYSNIQDILMIAGYDAGRPGGQLPEVHRRWLEIDRELADLLVESSAEGGSVPAAAFASRDPIITVGSVRLAGLLWHQQNLSLFELSGAEPDDTINAYADRLSTLNPRPNFLIAADAGPSEAEPRVTQEFAEAAAREAGFGLAQTIELPGGRTLRVWQR
jgi:4-amino-4-deoxy-L-arabinose transferase-like glycosyltransferase